MKTNEYKIETKVWKWEGVAAWHFLSVDKRTSKKIKDIYGGMAGGWGSLPVRVTAGKTSWKTSIFPDKKTGTYLLPLKAEVRKKEKILEGDVLAFKIQIMV